MFYDVFDSPVGQLTAVTDGQEVAELHIPGDKYFYGVKHEWIRDSSQPVLRWACRELAEYFAGQRREFSVPVSPGGAGLQQQVWQVVRQIPYGELVTYGRLAELVGRPRAARAVGGANGRNPVCILIPCHRVVGSDGSMMGYVAGVECKEWLLRLEQGSPIPPSPGL